MIQLAEFIFGELSCSSEGGHHQGSEAVFRRPLPIWRWTYGLPVSSASAGQQSEFVPLRDPSGLE